MLPGDREPPVCDYQAVVLALAHKEFERLTLCPTSSQVRRYKLQNISLERLMQALVSLDQHVEIVVQPAQEKHMPGITVAA
jgi:hypothetical protein